MEYSYVVVEGPHDLEFIGRLFRDHGIHKVQREEKLDAFWHPLIPRRFPPDGDLLKRVPVPAFFQNADYSVAIHSAIGSHRLVPTVEETFRFPGFKSAEISSIGLFLDADQNGAHHHFGLLSAKIQTAGLPPFPDEPGIVNHTGVRTGVFIFPDNLNPGTLENLLDECAARIYPELRDKAKQFTAGAAAISLTKEDRRNSTSRLANSRLPWGASRTSSSRRERFRQTSQTIAGCARGRWRCQALPGFTLS